MSLFFAGLIIFVFGMYLKHSVFAKTKNIEKDNDIQETDSGTKTITGGLDEE